MSHTTTLTSLPSEVLAQIYSSLGSRQDVDSLSQTCQSLAVWELYRHTIPGFPVSKEAAQRTFSALGKDSWKQVYDGKFHDLGASGGKRFQSGFEGAFSADPSLCLRDYS